MFHNILYLTIHFNFDTFSLIFFFILFLCFFIRTRIQEIFDVCECNKTMLIEVLLSKFTWYHPTTALMMMMKMMKWILEYSLPKWVFIDATIIVDIFDEDIFNLNNHHRKNNLNLLSLGVLWVLSGGDMEQKKKKRKP